MHGATGVCCFVRHIQKFTVMLIKTAETHSLWSIQPFLFKLIYRVIRSAALNHKKLLLFKKKCHLLSSLCSVFHHRLTSEAARLLATMLYSLSEKLFAIIDVLEGGQAVFHGQSLPKQWLRRWKYSPFLSLDPCLGCLSLHSLCWFQLVIIKL